MRPKIDVFWKQDFIQNGNFTNGSKHWVKEDGWSIQKNIAHCNGTQQSFSSIYQETSIICNQQYLVAFEIRNYENGDIKVIIGGGVGTIRNNNGIYYEIIEVTQIHHLFQMYADQHFIGDILNISATQIKTLPLQTKQIKDIENLKQQIEDKLFTFKSDSISFDVRNYDKEGYFSPEDFITKSDIIYRLDLTMYFGNSEKTVRFFVNNDASTRKKMPTSDYIEVNGYELSSLFKDNGWYLGEILQEEDEKAYYKFTTGDNISLANICILIQTNTRKQIAIKKIPLIETNFFIDPILNTSVTTIEGNLEQISEGYYKVLDAYYDSTNDNYFLLTTSWDSDWANGYFDIHIHQIVNDTELVERGFFALTGTWADVPTANFVHTGMEYGQWNVAVGIYYTRSGAVMENNIPSSTESGWIKYMIGQIALSTARFMGFKYDENGVLETITNEYYSWTGSYPSAHVSHFYINKGGGWFYGGDVNDGIWSNNNSLIVGSNNTYELTTFFTRYYELYENNGDYAWTSAHQYWNTQVAYAVYRFPRKLYFDFKNVTLSDILKELCITQDNVWYLDYENGITVKFTDRKFQLEGNDTLSEKDIGKENTQIKKIKFDDLTSQIFTASKDRMLDLINYYNGKYGNGKMDKDLEMRGHWNYSLGQRIIRNDLQWMIKNIEWEDSIVSEKEIKRRTYLTLFELGEKIFKLGLSDKLVLNDNIKILIKSILQDTLNLSDEITTKMDYMNKLQDTATLLDEIIAKTDYKNKLQDSILLSDTINTSIT